MNVSNTTTVSQTPITYTKRNVTEQKAKNGSPRTDTLTLTEEAQKFLQTQRELENPTKAKREEYKDDLQRFLENLNSEDDDKGNSFMDIAKCMKIAKRIQNGDKVPMKDIKFLAKNQPKLFMMAMTFRRNDNPDPKKYKTALDKKDEERVESEGEYTEVTGAGSGMSVEALAEGLGE